ncbi:MAG: EAL domain-containing protein [Gammaproteobacteria bacterium]|nr:EAL domain-containing protein [Gammaproteobacteria bacterium]MBU1644819.1 EAL domain-containing protein [Gammaproteobacteria bacterium]MBU1973052.1 EAL domain-containing protein [Gammaproteobacteria bacterium]
MTRWLDFLLHSVRGRIIVGVVLLHAVLMGLVVSDMVVRQQDFMQAQLAREGASLAQTLALNAPSWLISNDVTGMDELVDSLRAAPNLQLALIQDRQGKVRASTDPDLLNLVLDDADSRRLLTAGGPRQIWHGGLVDSASDIVSGGRTIGHARVIINAGPVQTELDAVTRKGIAYTLFAILFGGMVAWLAVRTMTNRLERLSNAADRIAAGNLDVELAADRGRDEVARLTRDFGQMVAALADDRRRRDDAEALLFEEKERAQVTLASIGDGVITTDMAGKVGFLNSVAEILTGWTNAEAAGLPLEQVFRIINEDSRAVVENPVEIALRTGTVVGLANHTVLIRRDGAEMNIEDSAAPIRDRSGTVIGVVLVFHDVTQAHEMARRMGWAATHDSLTGLHNRAEFERRLQALIQRTDLGRHHALLYIDLDQFKVVNDTCGHAAGDQMLCQIATLMHARMRESDTLARLGGDEFGVLLENCPAEKARQIAEGILEAIRSFRFAWDDKAFLVGASIGVVEMAGEDLSATQLLAAADTACYAAKDGGRNRIQIFNASDTETIRRSSEMHWVAHINKAFDDNRFRLYWQAIEPLREDAGGGRHGEILLRMIDDAGELVSPAAFLPAAERYNLMPRIDRWVVSESLRWLADNPQMVQCGSINLSGQSLGDEQLLDFVLGQLGETAVDPGRICFEITETAAIANLTKAIRFIGALRASGCRFSLDDFGSGLSSFGYLKNLPVDFLKIDGGFIRNIIRNPVDQAMVAAINNIGHVMGLETIAEFVESEEIRLWLRAQGVDYGQGYAIARPVPLEGL